MTDRDREIDATVVRERGRLRDFIRRRVGDAGDAEDILQDVFQEFVQAYRLPEPIEQVSAWLFRVARNRIIDRFRKRREQPLADIEREALDDPDQAYRLDLELPSHYDGPEAAYARRVLIDALWDALDELPANQREIFIAHELDGKSFKTLARETGVGINTLLARKRYAVLHLRERLRSIDGALDS
ncbi:sigma-70 family RNA polymerase sigma factor [Pararobbsia silviterrae]|uniref:Sigma-70 family RNA polymerase sigma factor n=2 Tax=Pararobbsia silviterrae TaxID=1792498 RepID=A0A494XS60_9BURK|nr:sigma-70 family RNA polymerase sigma factor [Pararobbsia silviterrae]